MTESTKITLVSTVKNEGPFLLEWIAHNLNLGIDAFVIFSNHCTDGSDLILDRLEDLGIIRHVPNPEVIYGTSNFHRAALNYARHIKEVRRADYVFVSDVDEFVWMRPDTGGFPGLLRKFEMPDAISFTEIGYGFGGVMEFRDEPVLEQFLYRGQKGPEHKPRRGVKTMARRGAPFLEHSNHRPRIDPGLAKTIRWVNGSGAQFHPAFIEGHQRGIDSRGTTEHAFLCHYPVRSADAMLAKYDRGDAVRKNRMKPSYINVRGGGRIFDDCMVPWSVQAQAARSVLLRDAELRRLHEDSVRRFAANVARVKADPDYREIVNRIQAVARDPELQNPDVIPAE